MHAIACVSVLAVLPCAPSSTVSDRFVLQFLEAEYLPPYYPNEEEKKDPKLYALNVREYMCAHMNMQTSEFANHDVMLQYTAEKVRCTTRQVVCVCARVHVCVCTCVCEFDKYACRCTPPSSSSSSSSRGATLHCTSGGRTHTCAIRRGVGLVRRELQVRGDASTGKMAESRKQQRGAPLVFPLPPLFSLICSLRARVCVCVCLCVSVSVLLCRACTCLMGLVVCIALSQAPPC